MPAAFTMMLRRLRKERHESQGVVAKRAGITRSRYNHLESSINAALPEPGELERIAAAVGVTTEDVLREIGYLKSQGRDDTND